ncbi:hypothetical protein GCM10011410_25940 [Hoyosella rhizosphaerae]|uniref:SMP-30/Gluconolactonase/LRE-like region domain-containing protein n=1 Tax=Hoyosella rhizosphaerae TaxID=1755582 RepID=A0A916UG28_9ACTN|nr:hypothetical protein GCM10011410_25940 [Hoyosella rhizosphaerae]
MAQGLGPLENINFDQRGGMLLSEQSANGIDGSIKRLEADGPPRTLVANIESPGGIVVDGDTAYFTTGNSFLSGLTNQADGTLRAVNLDSGRVTTVADGLRMPNGLAQLPDGDFVVSRNLGPHTGLTKISRDGTQVTRFAEQVNSPNGLALDAERNLLVASTAFDADTNIVLIDIDNPTTSMKSIAIPGFGALNVADDLTVSPDGQIFVALNGAGRIVQVDPEDGSACSVTDSVPFASSVRFGSGPGWDSDSLYVSDFLGNVTRLTPPATP